MQPSFLLPFTDRSLKPNQDWANGHCSQRTSKPKHSGPSLIITWEHFKYLNVRLSNLKTVNFCIPLWKYWVTFSHLLLQQKTKFIWRSRCKEALVPSHSSVNSQIWAVSASPKYLRHFDVFLALFTHSFFVCNSWNIRPVFVHYFYQNKFIRRGFFM